LIDAQDTRNLSDYGVGPGVEVAQLEELVEWAEALLVAAEAWLAAHAL
jgi:hypothetical protein